MGNGSVLEGGGRDEGESAFGQRFFPRRPGDRVDFPPRISFQEQLHRKREFIEIAHLWSIAGVPEDIQLQAEVVISPFDHEIEQARLKRN